MKSVSTALKPKVLPMPRMPPPGLSWQLCLPQADPRVETTAFNQVTQAMGRVYGPHLDVEKTDSFCGFQGLSLGQPEPMCVCSCKDLSSSSSDWRRQLCRPAIAPAPSAHSSGVCCHPDAPGGPLRSMGHAPVHTFSEQSSTN